MKYFKAKIPFSSGAGIFNPADKQPHKAEAKLVDSWVNAGYAVEVEVTEAVIKEVEPEDNFKRFEYDAQNEPVEPIKVEVIEKVETEQKQSEETPKKASKDKFEEMSYPQLKKAAKTAGIKGYQSMKQKDLIKALKGE